VAASPKFTEDSIIGLLQLWAGCTVEAFHYGLMMLRQDLANDYFSTLRAAYEPPVSLPESWDSTAGRKLQRARERLAGFMNSYVPGSEATTSADWFHEYGKAARQMAKSAVRGKDGINTGDIVNRLLEKLWSDWERLATEPKEYVYKILRDEAHKAAVETMRENNQRFGIDTYYPTDVIIALGYYFGDRSGMPGLFEQHLQDIDAVILELTSKQFGYLKLRYTESDRALTNAESKGATVAEDRLRQKMNHYAFTHGRSKDPVSPDTAPEGFAWPEPFDRADVLNRINNPPKAISPSEIPRLLAVVD
jgi:hypothetical protein